MLALGYFRLTEPDTSAEQLQKSFTEYCDLHLHQPIRVFVDVPGGPSYPEYTRMIGHMMESSSNFLVVVPGAAHLGTDLETVAGSVLELEQAGAKVTCDDEELPDPLQNALSTIGVKNVSRDHSARISASMRRLAIEGRNLGRPPYGYRNGPSGVLQVQTEEAEVVRLVFKLYSEDRRGLRLIAHDLNTLGLRTRKGGNWNVVALRDILRNPVYVGTYTRFGLRVPKSHEAIVASETFRKAQDILRERSRRVSAVASEPFLLSGIAYCAECGNKMIGVTRRQTWRRKNGLRRKNVYRYYQCQSRNNQSICQYHTWRANALETRTLQILEGCLAAKPTEDSLRRRLERGRKVEELSGRRLANAELRFIRALKKVASGETPTLGLARHLDELKALRRRTEAADALTKNASSALDEWDTLTISDKQQFLMREVDRVIVGDDSVEVIL